MTALEAQEEGSGDVDAGARRCLLMVHAQNVSKRFASMYGFNLNHMVVCGKLGNRPAGENADFVRVPLTLWFSWTTGDQQCEPARLSGGYLHSVQFVWQAWGGAFGQVPLPPLKEWGVLNPSVEGVHRPAALSFAGNNVDKSYTFVLGEEENSLGSWFVLTRYRTDSGNPPDKEVAVWPSKETPGTHRPVAMAIHEYWGFPPGPGPIPPVDIDVYAVGRVETGDGLVRTMTVAWTESADGSMVLKWTREFTRTTDELEDNVPVAISVSADHVAVLAACYTNNGNAVTYGLNVYNALNGTEHLKPKMLSHEGLTGDHVPVDIALHPDAVFITGYAEHPCGGRKAILTVAYDLIHDSGLLPAWDPRNPATHGPCHGVYVSVADYHLEPVRMFKRVAGDADLFIAGNAKGVSGSGQDMFIVSLRRNFVTGLGGYVRWADQYDSGDADFARDVTALSESFNQTSGTGRKFAWMTGTTYGSDDRARIRTLQYDDAGFLEGPAAGFPYFRQRPDPSRGGWEAEWEPENGWHAEGFKINHLRDLGGFPSTLLEFRVFVAGLMQPIASPTSEWHHVVLRYQEPPPVNPDPKRPYWISVDSAPLGENGAPVDLDVRRLPHEVQQRFWFSGPAPENGDTQWYTAQFLERSP